jgi:hypothetical protein
MYSGSSSSMVDPLLDPSFNLFGQSSDMLSFQEAQPSMNTYSGLGQSPMYNDLVMHYFNVTSKLQFVFCGSQLSEITYNVSCPLSSRYDFADRACRRLCKSHAGPSPTPSMPWQIYT